MVTKKPRLHLKGSCEKKVEQADKNCFARLPINVLTLIASFSLDTPSLLSLARITRAAPEAIKPVLWRHLDIRLPSDDPGLKPPARENADRSVELPEGTEEDDVSDEAEWARAAKMLRRVQQIRNEIKGHGHHIRSLSIDSIRGANSAIVDLLGIMACRLKRLEVKADSEWSSARSGTDNESLGFKLLEFDVLPLPHKTTFSSLTHIRLDYVLHWWSFLPLITNLSPNLIEADIPMPTWSSPTWPSLDENDTFNLPEQLPYRHDTKLSRLRLRSDDLDDSVAEHVTVLLQVSPDLESLVLAIPEYVNEWDRTALEKVLRDLPMLRDLQVHGMDTKAYLSEEDAAYPALASLTLRDRSRTCRSGFRAMVIPPIPHMTVFYMWDIKDTKIAGSPTPYNPTESDCYLLSISQIAWLLGTPHLARIHCVSPRANAEQEPFDPLIPMMVGDHFVGSRIYSYHHGGYEIFHVRTYGEVYILHESNVGTPRRANMRSSEKVCLEMAWEDGTFYQGKKVPLNVLEEMRLATGMSVHEWEQRGVQVGDAAWNILVEAMSDIRAEAEIQAAYASDSEEDTDEGSDQGSAENHQAGDESDTDTESDSAVPSQLSVRRRVDDDINSAFSGDESYSASQEDDEESSETGSSETGSSDSASSESASQPNGADEDRGAGEGEQGDAEEQGSEDAQGEEGEPEQEGESGDQGEEAEDEEEVEAEYVEMSEEE